MRGLRTYSWALILTSMLLVSCGQIISGLEQLVQPAGDQVIKETQVGQAVRQILEETATPGPTATPIRQVVSIRPLPTQAPTPTPTPKVMSPFEACENLLTLHNQGQAILDAWYASTDEDPESIEAFQTTVEETLVRWQDYRNLILITEVSDEALPIRQAYLDAVDVWITALESESHALTYQEPFGGPRFDRLVGEGQKAWYQAYDEMMRFCAGAEATR